MRKKLSLLIALAISLSITSTSFADTAANSSVINTTTGSTITSTTPISSSTSSLTLEQALNNVASNNIELKNIDDKINALNKQYNNDKQQALAIEASGKSQANYGPGEYVGVVIQQQITPLSDEQKINDAKNSKDERLNGIKFDLEKQYMNAVTAKQQIDNINKNIAVLEEQIKQTEEKIKLGQATQDALNPLKVQKSGLLSQIASPNIQLQQSLLNVKKYLNIDGNADLTLSPAKKEYIKFDDADIADKINNAVQKDYTLGSTQKSVEITKMQVDIQTKYAYDSVTEPMNSKLTLQDLQNKLNNSNSLLVVSLWNSYYNLKNKEDTVQTQLLSQESAQMSYDKAKQQFANGMIDKVALASAELALNNQNVTTENAINDYMIAQEQFNYMLNGHASSGSIS